MYRDWGFKRSPFETTSLPASEFGAQLLVGRDRELNTLKRYLTSSKKIPVIEGLNGVGKTSLINVASFQLLDAHMNDPNVDLFIPCKTIFQLDPNQSIDIFVSNVYYEIAQTLIEQAEEIKRNGQYIETSAIGKWLNDPQISAWQAGMPLFNVGMQTETNTSLGFESSGFERQIKIWLNKIFPEGSGGIICTIDNLELLQTSENAKNRLEELRDRLLNVPGLRWVLCGSLGITYGITSSPRLTGYLQKPIEVGGIVSASSSQVLSSRIAAYAKNKSILPYLPLSHESFQKLYKILNGNLRNVLNSAEDYCQAVVEGDRMDSDEEKVIRFDDWCKEQASVYYEAIKSSVRPTAMKVFYLACQNGGMFSPGDFDTFGFKTIKAIRPHIRDLQINGLLVSAQDDIDKRRKTIQILPKGWMVWFYLSPESFE